jgi:DNA-binding helix-hairpin-helix protein with protein kinase domain
MQVRPEGDAAILTLRQIVAAGGEATIYTIPERPRFLAKVYHHPTAERAEKLAIMLGAPPDDPMAGTGHPSIAWPTTRLRAAEAPHIVGFFMPYVEQGRLAVEIYNPRVRQQLCPLFHYRYLVRTAHNLAAAVRAIHERGYIIGDINESNVLVTNQALVTLVDTDSFQVRAPGRLFRCRVGKPEYMPPELHAARLGEIDRGPEHDSFGLAVLIFQFLMQGFHPFAGVYHGLGEAASLPNRIAEGHWPYTRGKERHYRPSPHAPPWASLPLAVQELMWACFEEGRHDPRRRPSAAAWQRALQEAERDLLGCSANRQHFFHRGLAECPWCAMAKRTGRDPFPELVTDVQVVSDGPGPTRRSAALAVAPVASGTVAANDPAEPARLVPWLRADHTSARPTATPRWLGWAVGALLVVLLAALVAAIFLYRTWAEEEDRELEGQANAMSIVFDAEPRAR